MSIVHVHIEKTAGTTLKSSYNNVYGADNVWGYSAGEQRYRSLGKKLFDIDSERQVRLRAAIFRNAPRIARFGQAVLNALPSHKALTLEEAEKNASVIIGHFTFDQVSPVMDPRIHPYYTVVRHPLDRMRSHHNFLQQRSVPSARMRTGPVATDGMAFEEFALQPPLRNYQRQAIGDSIAPYALVGVVNYLDAFLVETGLQSAHDSAPHINRSNTGQPTNLSPCFINEFEAFHAEDYELYQAVLQQWQPKSELQ